MITHTHDNLLNELQTRYAELEMQNKELRLTNVTLGESLSHYVNLHEVTSVGHLTLTHAGLISEIDLAGAKTLGLERQKILRRSFSDFVTDEDRVRWQHRLLDLIHNSKRQSFELTLKNADNSAFHVQLDCLRLEAEGEPLSIQVTLFDMPERRQADRRHVENELRIAATVFESQVGMIVTDAHEVILRVNRAFSDITGYTPEEVVGHTPRLLSSGKQDKAFYSAMWDNIDRSGTWQGEIWNRRKTGELYPEFMTITAVTDHHGQVMNYVATLTDSAKSKQQEQIRLAEESAHRDALVREVHHRIKNNLQGVTGVLRNFAAQHPEFVVPVTGAISQVQSIAVIHGLQGRTSLTRVRVCELTSEIAINNEALWDTPIVVDIPLHWTPCLIAETEAVPIALVLNELISNAIKHGDKTKGVNITFRHEPEPFMVQITITNQGRLPPNFDISQVSNAGTGLQLVSSLLPKKGANLSFQNIDNTVSVRLELGPTTITLEKEEMKK
ncbi:MAG: PAS domain S-box protein [Methylotenera sp.]|nr:PAS domain S-box protein [Methylotenera sp.]